MKKSVFLLLVSLAWAGSSQAQYTLPFTETFESTSDLPAGWASWQSAGSGDYWSADFGLTGGCAFSWYDGNIWLISKAVTVPAEGSVDIRYYQKNTFPTYYAKHGLYYSTTGAQNLDAWTAINANLGAGPWDWTLSPTYTLTGYAGTTVYIAWEYEGSFADGWYVDNVHMEVTPTCPTPTAVNATGITAGSATLGWTAASPAPSNGYDIYYSTSSTSPTSGTVPTATVGAGITTCSMVSLSENTVYYAWVRSNCGGSGASWTSVYSFTTLCDAVSVLPFNDGFESEYTDQAPVGSCWTQDGGIYEYYWLANSSQTMFNRAPRTGNWDATLLHYGNAWLFRKFTLTGGMYYTVSCWAQQDGSTPTDATIELKYGSVATPAGMTGDIQSPTGLSATYTQISGSFAPATTGDYYIGIHGVINGTPMYITLDDIQVSQTYSCFPPTAVAVTAISQTSASIAWTPPASAPASGYDIYYSTSSTPPILSTTPTASVAAGVTAYAMTPLTLGTTYYVWVRSNCGGGNLCMWSTAYSFSTHGIVPTAITVPGTYPNLTGAGGAFEAINCGELSGNTTISITADLTEPGTNALNAWTENPAESNYTLLIKPDASTLRTISGTLTYSASLPALIRTNGASRFTIDGQSGKYLTFRNTTASPAGTAGTVLFNNSSQTCYLKNSTLENNYNSTYYGTVTIGNTGSNSVEISGNDIRNATAGTIGIPAVGIYSASQTNSLSILNNNVYNFNSYGILMVAAANGAVISGNSVFYNSSTAPTGSQYGIYFMDITFNHLVTNNYVGGQAPLCQGNAWIYPGTGNFAGIYYEGTNAGARTLSNNIIRNIAMTSSGTSNFYGLKIGGGLFNIMNNTVGSETVAGSITYAGTGKVYGLYLASVNQSNAVENNIFGNWALTAATGTPGICGIYVYSMNARRNKIFNISASNAALTPDIRGIWCASSDVGTNEYSNNIISLDGGAATNPDIKGFVNDGNSYGMFFKFYYNDIHISGPPTERTYTVAFMFPTQNTLELKNNIFSNSRSPGGTNKHYATYVGNQTPMNSDYNDFYSVAGPLANHNYTDRSNLAEWKAATGQDAHSLSIDPLYVSSTDLHPQQPLLIAGTPIPGITTDYAGIIRPNIPTIGAYDLTQVATAAVTQTEEIMIFPVPNDGKFRISMTSASKENFTITVFNNLGLQIREIRDIQVNGRFEQLIDLRPVDPGIYMLVIRNSEQQIVRKIIVGK
ncbi:MAG: fibronectin type III domain-containing protein [Bacteroidales bacterium]|nr:fibronectin type III domain-containing protein [Bacteroidales bacterium]